ncbi:hypothetical protein ACQ4PT_017094 [Festuca glaucescens]
MSGPRLCSSQPQFMTSVGNNNLSNGAGTPLIDSIDVDQIVIPELLWIILIASCAALVIQSLDASLGVVTVIGTSFALNMLFKIPIWCGVLITGLSILMLLFLQQYGVRKLEFLIAFLLLWIILIASCAALVIHSLAASLGVVTGKHLAEHCRAKYPKVTNFILWILAELAVVACDIPEVIGTAFALNMLFKIPIWCGVLIIGLSTLMLLFLQQYGNVLGNWSSKVFEIALLTSGQSSTITVTYAGLYVMQITVLTWAIGSFIMIINIYFLITSFVKLLLHSGMSIVSQVFAGIFGFLGMLIYIAVILYLVFRKNRKCTLALLKNDSTLGVAFHAKGEGSQLGHLPWEDISSMQRPHERPASDLD